MTDNNYFLRCDTATLAWEELYSSLCEQASEGFIQPSRGGNIVGELINPVIVLNNPRKGIVLSEERAMSMEYAVGELLWYLSGSNKLQAINKYGKFWDTISDNGETLNSAYGHRIGSFYGFDQWEETKRLLQADPLSRQAVIHIKEASNKPSKDVCCTVALQFLIREEKLYCTVFMRSNDIWLGFPYDVFAFTSLQCKMAMELGVDVGTYTHLAGSLHLYERNYKED